MAETASTVHDNKGDLFASFDVADFPVPHAKDEVKTFLASACKDNTLRNSTHKEVYDLIKQKLGHPQP